MNDCISESTKRPWHIATCLLKEQPAHEAVAIWDGTHRQPNDTLEGSPVCLIAPLDKFSDEDEANAILLVQAVNEHEVLCEIADAAVKVLAAFAEGVFVRDITKDKDPAWAINLLPHLTALRNIQKHTDALKASRIKRTNNEH